MYVPNPFHGQKMRENYFCGPLLAGLPLNSHSASHMYEWAPANLMLGVTLWWTSMPFRGSRNTCSHFLLQKPGKAPAWWVVWLLVCRLSLFYLLYKGVFVGGVMASWLVHSTPGRAVWVRAQWAPPPPPTIVFCSWARHSAQTVPLSTQVYKWVPANLCWG